jgi:diguanylate cyclase (GGDEF)-like protein
MNEHNNTQQPEERHDVDMQQAVESAQHMLDDTVWHPVGSDNLRGGPLSDRERDMVISNAAGTLENVHALATRDSIISEQSDEIADLEKERMFDPLTHLRTAEVFRDDLKRAIALAMRSAEKHAFGIVMADGQGLNFVNNNIAHSAGDEYIVTIARALKASVRKSDGVYRGGGKSDEFFLMLPIIHQKGDDLDLFLRDKEDEITRKLEERLAESPRLHTLLNQPGTGGVYTGVAAIDFRDDKYVDKSPVQIAALLLEQADERLRQNKLVMKEHAN